MNRSMCQMLNVKLKIIVRHNIHEETFSEKYFDLILGKFQVNKEQSDSV